jgi:hypothetical protein
MSWDARRLTNLRKILAAIYPREADQRRLVRDAGLDESLIAFDRSAANSWSEILTDASHRRGKVDTLLRLTRDEHPENDLLARAEEEQPPELIASTAGLSWAGPPNGRALVEKVLGESSALVPTSFLALGLRRARAVAKVVRADGSSGTGFLIDRNTLITNHHVLPDATSAASATVLFDFQQTVEGLDEPATEVRLRPDTFFAASPAADDDWTAVALEGDANARWGALELGRATVKVGDRVNIIQHPGGGYKQLSFYANTVAFVGERRMQYLVDTMPGSSGAPVFDRGWNLVAIHHMGGWLAEPGGPPSRTFYRNQGIVIDALVAGLARARGEA